MPDAVLCGTTVVDLLGKTQTCAKVAGHAGGHESRGRVCWAQEDAALAVLAELVALEDEPHPNCANQEECGAWQDDYRHRNVAAWARARKLVRAHDEETT